MAMAHRCKNPQVPASDIHPRIDDDFDLETLLHPAQAFAHPLEVIRDPDLTLNEKRAILASWASDACAVEAAPTLRCAPASGRLIQFDDIIAALQMLDREASNQHKPRPHYRRVLNRRVPGVFGRTSEGPSGDDQGPSVN
jgi:hypothetical protein